MATATRVGIKLVFSFSWRGDTKVWSQKYHFTGPTEWETEAQFNTFVAALWDSVKESLPARVTCVEAVGYDADSDMPVHTLAIGEAGEYANTDNPQAPGEACMLWRFTTDARTSKNHPIYLFKWWHGMQTNGATSPDTLRSGIASTAAGPIGDLVDGISDGDNTRHYCGPNGAVALDGECEALLHMREFPN